MTFPATLNLIAWNCYVGNRDENVLHALRVWRDRFDPDVICLSEAATHADVLHQLEGFTVLQETPRPGRGRSDDTGDCAILVADHVTVRHRWVAAMARKWMVLRYRRWHDPHRYEVAQVKVRGHLWRVRSSHWPTHGFEGPNHDAFIESARRSRKWLRASLTRPSVDVGDLNEKVATLAAWFGPRFRVFGKGIDVAVTRNVRTCEWEELGKGGGDHYGRRYVFESSART
jgi:hypothetical protein